MSIKTIDCFHRVVQGVVDRYLEGMLYRHPATGQDFYSGPPTTTETHRVWRALYHLELICTLKSDRFLEDLPFWEVEQLGCMIAWVVIKFRKIPQACEPEWEANMEEILTDKDRKDNDYKACLDETICALLKQCTSTSPNSIFGGNYKCNSKRTLLRILRSQILLEASPRWEQRKCEGYEFRERAVVCGI